MAAQKNFINGAWIMGSGVTVDINPSDVSDVVGEYTQADKAQTEEAIAAAKLAFPAWSMTTPQQRADALEMIGVELLARKDEIGRMLAREEGKPLGNGVAETTRAAQIFKFFAQEALRVEGTALSSVRPGVDVTITREPVGVIGLIAPWNFPIAIPAWKIAPALAYGNCVVFKPADLVPGTAWMLAEIISRSGLPKGVFNLVMGRGSVVGQTLLDSRDVNAISFTGSVETGAKVAMACASRGAKFQLERGNAAQPHHA
jgi:alpha-ketoglutaric semialdehyde dehydrogenase